MHTIPICRLRETKGQGTKVVFKPGHLQFTHDTSFLGVSAALHSVLIQKAPRVLNFLSEGHVAALLSGHIVLCIPVYAVLCKILAQTCPHHMYTHTRMQADTHACTQSHILSTHTRTVTTVHLASSHAALALCTSLSCHRKHTHQLVEVYHS